MSNGENAERKSTLLPVNVCKTVQRTLYYYRVDAGCSCALYM